MLRLTARGIVINRNTGKILLIKYFDKYSKSTKEFIDGFWVLPGGGVKRNETFEEAIKREIYEETGIININVKNCVFSRIMHAELRNIKQSLYYERYYIVETDDVEISINNLTKNEIKVICEYKWWSINELKQTEDVIFPLSLKTHIDLALINPTYPIDISDSDELLGVSLSQKIK
ncbi:NUDIX domain-containing protein [Tissierella carlieri]|nr:NUDIX domain-containing protein [uncultured Tissierella sp.]MDU5083273.1 NUDIX domain-containing protein [Bacillota bacterium]